MGKPYSMDLRERVVAAVEKEGLSRHQAASRFDLGVTTVINWVRRFRETGSQRLRAKVPQGRWKTMTFLAALRHDRIDAPWLFDGPINGTTFRLYVERMLAPELKPGDIVIMDNLGSHRGRAVRQAIRTAGAKLFFLPKYSPDLNPIEQVFAKLKHLLRKRAARTVPAVSQAIGEVLDAFQPSECANFFKNAGYGPT
jgi:transposase